MSHGIPIQPAEPLTSSDRSTAKTPLPHRTPRSMLKNLFSWKRVSAAQDDEDFDSTQPNPMSRPQTACSKSNTAVTQTPSLFERSRSDTSVPRRSKTRSKSRRRSRSKCRAVWDPPPLFQAYNQAFMHDMLSVPNKSFLDWLPRNTSSRSSAKNSDSAEEGGDDDHVAPSISHRRSMSDSSTSSLCKKLFFIFENGHILQYKADGSQDRLPERVLELSRESVAFASDAIAGQHWVLEICPYGRSKEDGKISSGKLSWSRMSLKSTDNKRLAEKLLIVFENPESLFTWLIAIRKQIECLGGIEYQPDTPVLPTAEVKRPALRHASSEYLKRKNANLFSRSSSALPLRLDDPSAHEKDLPQLASTLSYQRSISVRSTATSSVVTTASLDRLRESYSGSSTTGTTLSSALSAASSSPTKETFHPLPTSILSRESKSRIPLDKSVSKPPTSPLHNSFERSSSPESVSDHTEIPEAPFQTLHEVKEDIANESDAVSRLLPQVITPRGTLDDTEIMDQETMPELRESQRQAQPNLSTTDVITNIELETRGQSSIDRRHASKPSLSSSSRGTYGLFPKKLAIDVKIEPLVVAEHNNVPGLSRTQATDHLEISESPITPIAAAFGKNLFARSNTGVKRPSPIALPHLLAPGELEQPQRSPAVTDAMLNSNFGVMPSGDATQPATPIDIKVPNFNDIQVDQSLINSVREIEALSTSPTHSRHSRSLAPRRSLPNFHYGSSSSANPIGPPPSGPLPAVPPVIEPRNSRDSTPSKRASSQSGNNRRASTKASSSTKKVRSPPPSYSMPPGQKTPSVSIGSGSPTLFDTQNASAALPSRSLSKKVEPPPTIGQVSVVSAPTPISRLSHHKKALSTSSVKSNRSKRGHTRSASNKSVHASLASLPPVSYFISPPCGSDVNFDNANKGCFGIRAGTT